MDMIQCLINCRIIIIIIIIIIIVVIITTIIYLKNIPTKFHHDPI